MASENQLTNTDGSAGARNVIDTTATASSSATGCRQPCKQ